MTGACHQAGPVVGPTSGVRLAEAAMAIGVRDPRLLGAIRAVPREQFVPARERWRAGLDEPVPIGHRQVTTQPSLVARMVEGLGLEGSETVLEVGTGHGYQTALLARLGRFVWSIERFADLAEVARANLESIGVDNAAVVVGDGTLGLPEHAPFDAVIVCAAFPSVPPALADQLAPGGRLVQPIGPGGDEDVTLLVKEDGRLKFRRVLIGARFVPLIGKGGFETGRDR